MNAFVEALPRRRSRGATEPARRQQSRERLDALLRRAEPMAVEWAERYDTAWALEDSIVRDARAWSVETARGVVRRIRPPQPGLGGTSALALAVGSGILVLALQVLPESGALATAALAAPGVLISAFGMRVGFRYVGIVAQHLAGIPPFRDRLEAELQRQAIAAVDRRRERLAGPRRPVPRHAAAELLPVQAQNVAARWMRHLGELDATVQRPGETSEKAPALLPGEGHIVSSGYVARVWSFAAETPDLELSMLEEAARGSGKRPLLFSLSGFPARMTARANRRGIALFTFSPWTGTLTAHGAPAERCLRRGLRDAAEMAT